MYLEGSSQLTGKVEDSLIWMMTLLKLREKEHCPASDTEAEKTWTERERERAYNMKYKTHTYTRESTMKNLRKDLP